MKRTLIQLDIDKFPKPIRQYLNGADIYDSSCSRLAKVYFIDKDEGFYLKVSDKGALDTEAKLTEYFNSISLGPKLFEYISTDCDMMLTKRVIGEDCTHNEYLDNPKKLCDTLAKIHHTLHSQDPADCPVKNKTADYLLYANSRYENGYFDSGQRCCGTLLRP